MTTPPIQQEFKIAVDSFISGSRNNYGNYAHAAGYLSSILAEMFENLTKKQQTNILAKIQTDAERQKNDAKFKKT